MMFRHNAYCYVAMPRHLSEGRRRVTVFTAAPVVHSTGWVEEPFWEDMDLAVALVRGPVAERCTYDLDVFASARPEARKTGQLVRLRDSGEVDLDDMEITESGYLTFMAQSRDGAALQKGTSGAFLVIGSQPVGMAIKTPDGSETEARFLRSEEIHMNLSRWLERRAGPIARSTPQGGASVARAADTEAEPELPFVFVSAGSAPLTPEQSGENLTGPGAYVYQPTRANRIVFRTRDGSVQTLSGLSVQADPESGYALPRKLRVSVSSGATGERPRNFLVGEVGPDGLYQGRRMPSRARWVFVTILDSWEQGPISVDEIRFE